MTHFNWSVIYLQKYSSLGEHNNIVYNVGYTCTGVNAEGTLSTEQTLSGSLNLSTEDLDNPVSYDNLTEEECVLKVIVRLNKRQLRDQVGYEYL